MSGLIDRVMTRFGNSQLPSPTALADTLGPLVAHGRLQFVSFDPADAPLLERLGLTGRVERPGSGDLLAVLTRNANPSKIDAYVRRDTALAEAVLNQDDELDGLKTQVFRELLTYMLQSPATIGPR